LTYTDPSGFRSDDRKTVCVDGCYKSGAGLEEVVVNGQRQSSRPQLQGNLAAGSFAGTGGGSHPPSSTIGDQVGPAGNPVAEEETEESEETEFDEQPEVQGCNGNHCLSTAPR